MACANLEDIVMPAARRYLDGEKILANVKALRPVLQARSGEIEALRRLPDDIVGMLREAGAFRMMMPRAWGGPEMNFMQINEALEELAVGNSAAAWCAMIQMDSGLYSGLLQPDIAQEIYGDIDTTTSNVLRPVGSAVPVEGGYLLNGRWPFASGCLHTDWFAASSVVVAEQGIEPAENAPAVPQLRMFLAPRKEWVIHDTWHTLGLRGTGSNDVEAVNLFIPSERTFAVPVKGLLSDTMASHAGAVHRWPAVLCAKMPGVVLGMARAAIESAVAIAKTRPVVAAQLSLALADAQTAYASARAYVYSSLEAAWASLEAGEQLSEAVRIDVMLARANAFRSARTAVQALFESIGGGIYAKSSDLERHLRDVNTACQHVMGQRMSQQCAGSLMAGIETELGFL